MKLFALLLAAAPVYALAASVDIQPIPDLPLKNVPPAPQPIQTEGGWQFSLGGGVSHAPRYEGAATDRVRFMPLLDASYSNGKIFVSPLRGLGYNFSDNKEVQYGVRVMPGHRRKPSDDPHLNGMSTIGMIPEAGLFYNRRISLWFASGGITTGSHGSHIELGTGIGLPLSASDRLRLSASLNWGDARYNQTYFGVTALQAAASGYMLTAFDARAGIKDYALSANWVHNYDKQWFNSTSLSYKWLTGSARSSPLTQRANAGSANFMLGYRF